MSIKGISTWSLAIAGSGIIFSIASVIRYYVIYPDMDRALVYGLIGIMIAAFGWVYNKILHQGNIITAIEDYLSDKQNQDLEDYVNKRVGGK